VLPRTPHRREGVAEILVCALGLAAGAVGGINYSFSTGLSTAPVAIADGSARPAHRPFRLSCRWRVLFRNVLHDRRSFERIEAATRGGDRYPPAGLVFVCLAVEDRFALSLCRSRLRLLVLDQSRPGMRALLIMSRAQPALRLRGS